MWALGFSVRVTTNAAPLHPLSRQEIFNKEFLSFLGRDTAGSDSSARTARRLERQVRGVELLSSREKLMAGLPNFATYFGRDMMMTALMMRPIWSADMPEHVIASVLRKLGPEGDVSHEEALGGRALDAARDTLHDQKAYGSVIYLVRAARRTAASMRERLSADFWSLLVSLESELAEGAQQPLSEAEALQQVESALQILAALSGLAQENMNRVAGWRFLDMGRRIERAINTCRLTRTFAHEEATTDDLDLLLDLADSQITYRARYLVGLARTPVRDMVLLDPFNPRSMAFQVMALRDHLAALPSLQQDGMLEEPNRILLPLATEMETADADHLSDAKMQGFERTLMRLSSAVADRYFQQGANAAPAIKLASLA